MNSYAYDLAKSISTRVCRPIVTKDKIWFEDYSPDKTDAVLLDDFRGEVSLAYMLQLCDGYELNAERKGASVIFKPSTIIITSNDEPDRWWAGKDLAPFWRRVNEGGGSYCLWLERPRITGVTGRVIQDGGLEMTYPQGGASLPALHSVVAVNNPPSVRCLILIFVFFDTACCVSRCPG